MQTHHQTAATLFMPGSASKPRLKRLLPATGPAPLVPEGVSFEADRDREFAAMLRAFRETGGLLRGDEVADLLQQRGTGDVSRLARWIVTRQVVSFEWRGEQWVPMFQFDLSDMSLHQEARHLAAELAPAFDGWALSLWCATPNAWLHNRLPADGLMVDFPAVLQAARADRFVAMG